LAIPLGAKKSIEGASEATLIVADFVCDSALEFVTTTELTTSAFLSEVMSYKDPARLNEAVPVLPMAVSTAAA